MPKQKYEKLLPEAKEQIIKDLEEGRLSYKEIAMLRLGASKPKQISIISRCAKECGISRKGKRPYGDPNFAPTFNPEKLERKPIVRKPKKIETFSRDERLNLIDEALTIHHEMLYQVAANPYKMERWTAALDRLLDQRRELEPEDDGENKLLDDIIKVVDAHAKTNVPPATG